MIFVNPSTLDGQLYDMQDLLALWQAVDCTIIIDESFLDFCVADSVAEYKANYLKLYIIKSLSKIKSSLRARAQWPSGQLDLLRTNCALLP